MSRNFELRDLFYLKQFQDPYWVVLVKAHTLRLFKGRLLELEEVNDDHFPALHEEQFVYQPVAVETTHHTQPFRAQKKDFSPMQWRALCGETMAYLKDHLSIREEDILLAGTQQMVKIFLEACPSSNGYLGMIHGKYTDKDLSALSQKTWEAFFQGKSKKQAQVVEQLIETRQKDLVAGLENAWRSALDGQGHTLLVEKDFYHKGYERTDTHTISIAPRAGDHGLIPDMVDDVMEIVYGKHGRILFTENDRLKAWGHLVLIRESGECTTN